MYNNKMNGYAPFRSSGSRMWGMSSSLPSGMSDYAAYPSAASSYPPPNHHYHHLHDQHHPHHHNNHHNNHHHHHNNFQPQHHHLQTLPPAHNPHHYGIPPPSPAPAHHHHQDTDFGGGMGGSRARMFDMPLGHQLGNVGQHLSASSTSSLTGVGAGGGLGSAGGHPGASYNGIGGSGGTNLIINYLPQDMTDRELFSLFRTMGPIETCRIMRDFKTNYSFGYAFINFVTEEGAQRAIKCLNGVTVRNKRLKVSYARPAGEEIKETNLYVTNLPKTITEEQMDVIFGKYGLIVQKNILRDKITGKPRGVAFIRFNKREEAQEAIAALNNVIPEGGSQPLTVRVAEEHGKSKAQQMFGGSIGGSIGGGGGSGSATPMNMAIHQQHHNPHHHQQQQQQQHMGGSSMNMMGYPMPPGGGAAGHFHHQSNAMHRGRMRPHHHNGPMQSNYHHQQHRFANRPY